MALIKNPLSGGGGGGGSISVVNGIIEQYKAVSGTIDANTFVEFVNSEAPGAGEDTKLSDTTYGGNMVSAVSLGNNKVLVVHNGDGRFDTSHVYGVVVTISGVAITYGTDTQICQNYLDNYGYNRLSAVLVSQNKVFIAHPRKYSNSVALYGIVVTISGDTITVGTDSLLSASQNGGTDVISASLISESKIFIAHNIDNSISNSNSRLAGVVIIVSGTTINIASSDIQLSTTYFAGGGVSATLVDTNTVFVGHNGSTSTSSSGIRCYGVIASISSTNTITAGTDTQLMNAGATYHNFYTAVTLTNGNVFLVSTGGGNSNARYLVASIASTTITVEQAAQLAAYSWGENSAGAVVLPSGVDVFVSHQASDNTLSAVVVTIEGSTVTIGNDTTMSSITWSGGANSSPAVVGNNVFVAHPVTGNILYGVVSDLSQIYRVRPATSAPKMLGLTAGSLTDTTAGGVWVLNTNESE